MSKTILGIAFINAAAVLALGVSRQKWPSAGFWDEHEAVALIALGVTAIVPLLQALVVERGERSRRVAVERQQNIAGFLSATLVHLVRTANADWETTGVHAFVLRKKWFRPKQHVRVARVRMSAVASSGVKWVPGKGVIGRCAETRRKQFVDVQRHFQPFAKRDKAGWDNMSAKQRFGLTYEDFDCLRGKYGIVAAVPVINDKDEYVGCIAMDTPPDKTVIKEEALRSLEMTAGLVKQLISA